MNPNNLCSHKEDGSGVKPTDRTSRSKERDYVPNKSFLDSGCTGSCISQRFAEEKESSLHKWEHPISAYNTDRTENNNRKITHYAEMKMIINGHPKIRKFAVTNLGQSDMFLGHEWLNFHNPEVDWTTGSLWSCNVWIHGNRGCRRQW